MKLVKYIAPLIAAISVITLSQADDNTELVNVPYPEGYRTWSHVKSMIIQPGHPLADSV